MHEQILTSKEGSFARFTIINRVPPILEDLIAHNSFSPDVEQALKGLLDAIPEGKMTPLVGASPYAEEINQTLTDNPGYGWLSAPFLFVENYLYHKIAEICGYFSNGFDYFHYKKVAEAGKGLERFSDALKKLGSISSFSDISLLNLRGNKADLSQSASYYSSDSDFELLIDHRDAVTKKIEDCFRVDLVLDNAGEELFFDLTLAHWLLSRTGVRKVKLHFKTMPYFVSDALISDYRDLLNLLSGQADAARFAGDMNRFEEEGKLELSSHPFLASGQLYSRIPRDLAEDLSGADLVIFKGDLNYRRLVGDDYHPYETKTSSLVNYFSSDVLISRILKSEVVVGLAPDMVPHREKTDWMFNGKYGEIELVEGTLA